MDGQKTVSIAMACFNGEKYLRQQLDSILAQTVSGWELVACDDASTDGTLAILEEYAARDPRIRVSGNAENLGFKKNFERALSLCRGDFVALSDQDDVWTEDHLAVLLENIRGRSAAAGNATVVDGEGRERPGLLSAGDRFFEAGDDLAKLHAILCLRNPFFGALSLYDRDLLRAALPIPDGVAYHDVWLSAAACCLDGLDYTFSPVAAHRVHGANESGEHRSTLRKQAASLFSKTREEVARKRMELCDALLARFPGMAAEKREAVLAIRRYHENRFRGNRPATLAFTWKHFRQIYSTRSPWQLFLRTVQLLVTG